MSGGCPPQSLTSMQRRVPTPKKAEVPAETAFILSDALPVVPAKLVKRILRAEYIDMAELLKDNMEAERRRMLSDGGFPQSHFSGRPTRREVPDLLNWLQCFSLYAAVVTSKFLEKRNEHWAYQATLIGEERRCSSQGWMTLVRLRLHKQVHTEPPTTSSALT